MSEGARTFIDLVARVSAEWAVVHRDEQAFPAIARAALERARIHEALGYDHLVDVVLAADPLPPQIDPGEDFGQPPVTIATGEGFVVELLFWVDGLVSIHQHGFRGAFQVFSGESIHTRYRFEEKRRVSSALLLGEVSLVHTELLSRGDVREIAQGSDLVHATVHTARPTVTIVVRTIAEQTTPQYDYRPPSVAYDPIHARPTLRKRLQMLRLLQRTDLTAFFRAAGRVVGADLLAAYEVLERSFDGFDDPRHRATLVALAREAHGAQVEPIVRAVEASAAQRDVVRRLREETDPETRFFLALLATVPSRPSILSLLAARYPDADPTEVVARCVGKLGFNSDAVALCRALLGKKRDHRTVRVALARSGYRVANDYELLQAIRVLRETPGFGALFGP